MSRQKKNQNLSGVSPRIVTAERGVRPCMADPWGRRGADRNRCNSTLLETFLAHQRPAMIDPPSAKRAVLWSGAGHGDTDQGHLGRTASDTVAAGCSSQRSCCPQVERRALIHPNTLALAARRRLGKSAGTRVSLRAQGWLSWVAAVLALLNTLFVVAGQEAFWSSAVPTQVTVGQRVNVSLTGTGFLVGANDYFCLFQTEVVNQFIGEYENRRSPLEIISENSAQCTTPEWDLPAMDTAFQIIKSDEFVPAERPWFAFRFLHAVSSVEPTAGPAGGAQAITFSGHGFGNLPGSVYTSTFTGGGSVEMTSEPCSVDEPSSKLICNTPTWASSAGLTSVTVRNNAERLSGRFRSLFRYVHSLSDFVCDRPIDTAHLRLQAPVFLSNLCRVAQLSVRPQLTPLKGQTYLFAARASKQASL